MATKKMTSQRFMALSESEKKAFVATFEKGVNESQFRPMTQSERKRWEKSARETKRMRRGRPVVGDGSK